MSGVLINVDYEEELTRLRIRELLGYIRRLGFPFRQEVLQGEILADSFYVHYRKPLLKNPNNVGQEHAIWYTLISTYVSSDMYRDIASLSQYNYSMSRRAALKILRAYNSILARIERRASNAVRDAANKNASQLMNDERFRNEIGNILRFYMGTTKSIERTQRTVSVRFGSSVGKEAAELLFDVDIDPYRARLAKMLESLVEITKTVEDIIVEEGSHVERRGIAMGIKRMSNIKEIQDASITSKAVYSASRELFAYKLATKSLSVRERHVERRNKIYMLIDKSGSMFYSINDVFSMDTVQKITWAAAIAIAIARTGGKIMVRFFDQAIHPPLQTPRDIIRALLRVIPLGGTDINSAILTAISDASRNASLRSYKLLLITDGEDDMVNPEVVRSSKKFFRDVKAILIGGSNPIIEGLVPTIKISEMSQDAIRAVLSHI